MRIIDNAYQFNLAVNSILKSILPSHNNLIYITMQNTTRQFILI